MSKLPTDRRQQRYAEIKRVITENDATVAVYASILGMNREQLSRILNSTLRKWWLPFKQKRKKKRESERLSRYRQRKAQALQDTMNQQRAQQGLPPVYPWVNPEDYV